MERRKKKSSHGGDGELKRSKGGGSKRVLVLWADAQHEGDDDAGGEASANQADRETPPKGTTAGGSIENKKKAKSEEFFATEEVDPLVKVVAKTAKQETTTTDAKAKGKKQQKQKKNKEQKQEKQKKAQVALLQKIREDKEKKKEKKKKAKQEKRVRKQADIDGDDHIDADVAFDSEEVESDDDDDLFGEASANMFEAHGFVMIDIENELDELALIADMATGEGKHVVQGASKKKDKKDKNTKKQEKKRAAIAKQAEKKGKADASLHVGNDSVSNGDAPATEPSQEQESKLTTKQKLKKAAGGERVPAALESKADAPTNEPSEQEEPKLSNKQKHKLKKAVRAETASVSIETSMKSEQTKSDGKHEEITSIKVQKKTVKLEKKDKKAKIKVGEVKVEESLETVEIRKERGRRSRTENGKRNTDDHNPATYEEYADRELVLRGLEDGTFLQGKLRVNSKYRLDGYVTVDGIPVDILVKGMSDRNRAFDGDLVAIQLRPESEWKALNDESEDGKDSGKSVMKPAKTSQPIDKKKLHSLWLPSVDTGKCFIEHPGEDGKQIAAKNVSKLQMQAIKEKVATLRLRPTAKVVYILAQGNTQGFIGSLEPKSKPKSMDEPLSTEDAYAYFNAHDGRLPRRIQIPRLQLPDQFVSHPLSYSQTMLCFCRIKSWSTKYKSPMGEFVKTVGEFSGIESGITAILTKHGLLSHTLDFDSQILEDLDEKYGVSGEKWIIPDDELQKRRDFRKYQIFSIDPYNARDLDDALHVRALNDDRTKFEIGVHIADVTHFIEEGSLLDKEAQDRATSVYLVNRVLPMLPRILCEKLCSLQPRVDRLAFSVVWQMNADGTLVDGYEPWFGKSVIRSCCKLDYGSAQKMLDGVITSDNVEEWEEARRPIVGENPLITNASVIQSVKDLWTIGKCRREMRFDTGAISLNSVKIVFSLDAKGNPVSHGSYQLKDSNRLVEEYMLLANYLVAQQLLRGHGSLAFIRNHPEPIAQALEQTLVALQENKLEIDGSSAKSLSESLEQVRVKYGETAYVIAQALIIKPMKPAEYMVAGNGDSAEAWRHYALNIPYYTHFTSPIRRYADVVVHRLLQESVACGESLPINDPDRDVAGLLQRFTAVSQNCNSKKVTAKCAETECDLVFLCAYVKHHGGVEVTGVVMSMGPQSFTVYIMGLGLEERVFLRDAQITGTWDENASNLAIRLRSNDKKSGKNSKGMSKPIQLSFMKKLRLVMDATDKMPLKLTFSVVGEAH
ncbi:Dis3-like exonuclease 2, partial [Globisporangium splendens]